VERDEQGQAVRLVGVNYDTTNLHEAEQALRESEARFRELADHISQFAWTADASGWIHWYNRRWYDYTGTNLEQMQGWGWKAVHHPDHVDRVVRSFSDAIEKGEDWEDTFPLKGADGVYRWFLSRAQPIRDRDGKVVRWFGTNTNIDDLRSAETALRGSEAQLRLVLDASVGGLYSVDCEGRTTLCSKSFLKMLGFERQEDALGKRLHGTIHHSHPDGTTYAVERCPIYRCARTGEPAHVQDEVFFKVDGTSFPVEYWVEPFMRDGEHVGAICTFIETSERQAAEAALREESRILETLNETGAAIAGELELKKLVQMVTDAGVALTGAQFGAFFYNVLNDAGESYMLYTLSGARPDQFDFGMPRATAVFHPTFAGEGPIRSEDIMADPRYGKSEPHFGMPEGHLPVRSYLAVPVISRSGEVLGGLFFGHSEIGRFTERHERLIVGIAAQAAVSIDNARLYQAAQQEVAERQLAEARLRELNETLEQRVTAEIARRSEAEEALRQAQKMETLGQLTGGVAHDFNNLLQIVTGNLEILQRNLPADQARLRRSAENAMKGAERASILTQRLLAFSRRQPLAPKPVSLNKLVAGMSELLHRTLGETIEVETVLASGLWNVEADPNQLENALLNLAVNARDAMGEGGKLTIETSNTHLDQGYVAQNSEVLPGQYVVVCISDTGSGWSRRRWSACSSPSSRPRTWARAPASASRWSMASSSSLAAM
jgi:PAS domain S-box-containing protein